MSDKEDDAIKILIPDGEGYYTYVTLSCFSEARNCKLYVMSDTKSSEMRWSNLVEAYIYCPKEDYNEAWIAQINRICKTHDIDVIMPTSDIGIGNIIKYGHLIDQKAKLTLVPPSHSFDIAMDKALLASHIKDKHYSPKTLIIEPDFDNRLLNSLSFPLLLKPTLENTGGKGIIKCKSAEAFKQLYAEGTITENYIAQEFIQGYDIDCSVICKSGEILVHTIQKGIMPGNTAYSPQLAFTFLENDKLLDVVKDLMQSLNWSGVAHVDLRYDVDAENFKVIEINPRFWGSVMASLKTNTNFPHLMALLTTDGKLPKLAQKVNVNYVSLGGLGKFLKQNKSMLFRPLYLWRHTAFKYLVKDPFPVFYKVIRKFKKRR